MAKLYFYYSAMNAGKSTHLLQANYNFQERHMKTLLLIPGEETRTAKSEVEARIGLRAPALTFYPAMDVVAYVRGCQGKEETRIDCLLLDEAQFLTKGQVAQLATVVDTLGIPVMAYGLRTDFRGELFEGSHYLLAWADKLVEVKTMCFCGRKATMTMRVDGKGHKIKEGEQVVIGGNEHYVSACRKHHREGKAGH